MSKKNIGLILFVVALGAIYIFYFTDFFSKPSIYISARPRLERNRQGKENFSVSFSFDGKCKLTELRVVPVADLTNKYAHAVWHLISDTNSATIKGLVYGEPIKGMKPKVPKAKAEPLEPGVKYRLLVQAGERQGQVDFGIPGGRSAAR